VWEPELAELISSSSTMDILFGAVHGHASTQENGKHEDQDLVGEALGPDVGAEHPEVLVAGRGEPGLHRLLMSPVRNVTVGSSGGRCVSTNCAPDQPPP
jgi:hypothetical protein